MSAPRPSKRRHAQCAYDFRDHGAIECWTIDAAPSARQCRHAQGKAATVTLADLQRIDVALAAWIPRLRAAGSTPADCLL